MKKFLYLVVNNASRSRLKRCADIFRLHNSDFEFIPYDIQQDIHYLFSPPKNNRIADFILNLSSGSDKNSITKHLFYALDLLGIVRLCQFLRPSIFSFFGLFLKFYVSRRKIQKDLCMIVKNQNIKAILYPNFPASALGTRFYFDLGVSKIIFPMYHISSKEECTRSVGLNPLWQGDTWISWLVEKLAPWYVTGRNNKATLFSLPPFYALIAYLSWEKFSKPPCGLEGVFSGGYLFSQFHKDCVKSFGYDISKYPILGDFDFDLLYEVTQKKELIKNRFARLYNFSPDTKILLVDIQSMEKNTSPFGDLNAYLDILFPCLKKASTNGWVSLFTFHPNIEDSILDLYRQRGAILVDGGCMATLPLADVYFTAGSTTLILAHALGIPTIAFDYYKEELYSFGNTTGCVWIPYSSDCEYFKMILEKFTLNDSFFAEKKFSAQHNKEYYGIIDGGSTKNITFFLENI